MLAQYIGHYITLAPGCYQNPNCSDSCGKKIQELFEALAERQRQAGRLVIVACSKSWELYVHQPPKKNMAKWCLIACHWHWWDLKLQLSQRLTCFGVESPYIFASTHQTCLPKQNWLHNVRIEAQPVPKTSKVFQKKGCSMFFDVFCRAWLGFIVAGSDISNLPWILSLHVFTK